MSMFDFVDVAGLSRGLVQQKCLLVNVCRGLDALHGRRGGGKAKAERSPAGLLVRAACAELLRETRPQGGSVIYTESAADVAQALCSAATTRRSSWSSARRSARR